ncbi:hypothetical protein [Spirosoma aerolatum]|uniref:hypothetical protein n=1 Tax=Spirosoma aerolatum TaxID=1211326 RepID=UPI0015D067D0|nr:hypothetical protein [Spirosoma aerolatum]
MQVDYKLTNEQALPIAVQIQRNQILENGLVVSRSDSSPAGLEALAIALGYDKAESVSINGNLSDIGDSLNEIKEVIELIPAFVKAHRMGNWNLG